MKSEETRQRLIKELTAQFSNTEPSFATSNTPDDPIVTFPAPNFEKPKMFMPKTYEIKSNGLETITDTSRIKGIGFKNNIETNTNLSNTSEKEIYNMRDFINTNPENMMTLAYDEKVLKAQLALVKRKEWQEILFDDVDWFMKIDIVGGIKKMFGMIK